MAQLIITIPDAAVPRIRAAFGRTDADTGERILATVADLQLILKNYIKGVVLEYEVAQHAKDKRTEIGNETWEG